MISLPFVPWRQLLAALILVILLVPIRRYSLPADLPFQLELYRLFVALLVVGWIGSLLVDRRVRLRRTGFEGPLAVILGAAITSMVVNPERVAGASAEVNKQLMFLLSYVVVLYLTVSGVRKLSDVDFLARCLVAGGAIVSVFALVEARLGFNAFNHLATVMPFLRDLGDVGGFQRVGTGQLRVFASAQHPIALSAALVMLAPLAIYLARRHGQRRWLICALVLGVACASTVSRTGVVMFLVVALTFLWIRPRETLRLWPALLAAAILTHAALPGTLGAIKNSFFPPGGLIAEQRGSADSSGSGRLADLGPALELWTRQPILGQGYGTNVVNPDAGGIEANIFDDQWLGTLLGTGIVGFVGWGWFFVRAIRRFGGEAMRDTTERGWLLTAITAGIAAFGVGMLTYDAFAFIQVTFLLFILVGLGSVVIQASPSATAPVAESVAFRRRPVTNPV
jgi:polysaccharide biosynthesis protein PslJ